MSYRDDHDATRARADALERELAAAKDKIAELEGQTALVTTPRGPLTTLRSKELLARVSASGPATERYFAAPTRMALEWTLDGELPESGYTEFVETIRKTVAEPGVTSTLPGSLTWTSTAAANTTGPHLNVYVTIRDGRTTVRIEEKLTNLAGAIYGGVGGGVGGGGIMLPISAAFINPLLLLATVPAWLGATYLACRKIYRSRARLRAERLAELEAELTVIAKRIIAAADADADAADDDEEA